MGAWIARGAEWIGKVLACTVMQESRSLGLIGALSFFAIRFHLLVSTPGAVGVRETDVP